MMCLRSAVNEFRQLYLTVHRAVQDGKPQHEEDGPQCKGKRKLAGLDSDCTLASGVAIQARLTDGEEEECDGETCHPAETASNET